ncbi:hypothetical protein D9M68_649690 [compost metagenome]
MEGNDVTRLQPADRFERQAFEPDARFDRDGRAADLLFELLGPFGLRLALLAAALREDDSGLQEHALRDDDGEGGHDRAEADRHVDGARMNVLEHRIGLGARCAVERTFDDRFETARRVDGGAQHVGDLFEKRHGNVDLDLRERTRLRLFYPGRLGAEQRLDEGDDDRAVAADLEIRAPVAQGHVADHHAGTKAGNQFLPETRAETGIADRDVETRFRPADVRQELAKDLAEFERQPADDPVVAERAGHARQEFPVECVNVGCCGIHGIKPPCFRRRRRGSSFPARPRRSTDAHRPRWSCGRIRERPAVPSRSCRQAASA